MMWQPACLIRGGTSKGLFFNGHHLPTNLNIRNNLFLKALGSPDSYGEQIDGLGGGSSSTSKVVVINKSTDPSYDVEYLFGQVDIRTATVDYSGSCGNMAAGVALFSLLQNLVQRPKSSLEVVVRVLQKNINKPILIKMHYDHLKFPLTNGCFQLFGVPNQYSQVKTRFMVPGQGEKSLIFPTGKVVDQLQLIGQHQGTKVDASIVNVGNQTVIVRAEDVGLTGSEKTLSDPKILSLLEAIRCAAALRLNIAKSYQEVSLRHKTFPKIAFVGRPTDYLTSDGAEIKKQQIDLVARIISIGKLHHTFTATGLLSVASCAAVPGSVPNQLLNRKIQQNKDYEISIGHRAGITAVRGRNIIREGLYQSQYTEVSSSCRLLMRGQILWEKL